MPNPVVTRFAPSPTGHLHIGGARTALFCWAFARRHGGKFMIRIEDTDAARSSEESARGILADLAWLGIENDLGPHLDPHGAIHTRDWTPGEPGAPRDPVRTYFQAQRVAIYNRYLESLIQSGRAYPAFESNEEIEAQRKAATAAKQTYRYPRPADLAFGQFNPALAARWARAQAGERHVLRFMAPPHPITVPDQVLGDVKIAAGELDDFVIRKADGFPTYHFAVVIDDELMGVTHILRAQEHLANTPRHVALQQALVRLDTGEKFRTPAYGHMPLIFNIDGTKMSKRDRDKAARKAYKDTFETAPPPSPDMMAWLMEHWISKSRLAESTKDQRRSIIGKVVDYFAYQSVENFLSLTPSAIVDRVWPDCSSATRAVYESHIRKYLELVDAVNSGKFRSWLSDATIQLGPDHVSSLADALEITLPEIEVWDFRRNGYLPEAINNFVSLLGWNPGMKQPDGKDLEKFDTTFLCQHFGIDKIGRTNSKFDRNKLLSFNADYIAAMSDDQFADRWVAWMKEHEPAAAAKIATLPRPALLCLAKALKPRAKTLRDALRPAAFAMVSDTEYPFDPAAVDKNLLANDKAGLRLLAEFRPRLAGLADWTPEAITAAIESFAKEKGMPNPGGIAQPLRVALTGTGVSPGLGETLAVLGRISALARIDRALHAHGG